MEQDSDYVQLGTLTVRLSLSLPSFSEPRWNRLTPSFYETLETFGHATSFEVLEIIRDAMSDPGLGFQAEWIRADSGEHAEVRVRCTILPSDVRGSMWKSVPSARREKTLKRLLGAIRISWTVEEGMGPLLLSKTTEDHQSMQDIYTSIPSPSDPIFEPTSNPADQDLFSSLENFDNPAGVKTDLYRYQLRSVAKMVQMETQPRRLVDPAFTAFREAGRDAEYYINLNNWDIQRYPGWYELPKGGILCEQMGTGKTLMCLSLIVSTLHQPTLPPDNSFDMSQITTDVAERTYPFAANADLRQLTGYPRSETRLVLPSLVDLAANILVVHDPSARRTHNLPPPIESVLDRKTFYCTLPIDDDCARAARRRSSSNTVSKLYLAKGTLVVVPGILLEQWKSEVSKHLHDGAVRVLAVGEMIPKIEALLEYDLILMDVTRFALEETQHRKDRGLPPSVLLQARWKRIILDEGHVAANRTTNSMAFSRQLKVERRWLVSGTPTRHLQQGGEVEMDSLVDPGAQDIFGPHERPEAQHNGNVSSVPSRQWSLKDLEDATRLDQMIGGFLAVEPYRSDVGFQQLVTSRLKGAAGPDMGAVRRLKAIMAGVMVKHGPREIDHEAALPPSTIQTTVLQFDPMQRITYNVLAALVASNVYTSGGEDADYFLHPSNRDTFLRVVSNLHLACFWYSAPDIGAEDGLRRTRFWLNTHPDANEHARSQLDEACKHLETALHTPGWNEWMGNAVSMAMDGIALPGEIQAAWSDSAPGDQRLIDTHSLLTIREANEPGTTLEGLIQRGCAHREQKQSDIRRELEMTTGKKSRGIGRKSKDNGWSAANAPKSAPKSISTLTPKSRGKRTRDDIDLKLEEAERNAAATVMAAAPLTHRIDGERIARPLPSLFHTRSRSAKANFVAKLIIEAAPDDKFVIFGDVYELGHLTELLDLLDITSTYVGGHSIDRRAALESFQKPEIRVCLLDLRTGARGLNLVVANRVIFLQPVWSPDVQAQAIKRVHRIGQTRPTTIHVLVTEGTFEEEMAQRSLKTRSDDAEKLYSRNMIENPRFVYAQKEQTESFAVRFVPKAEMTPSPISTPTTSASFPITPTEYYPTTPLARSGHGSELVSMAASPSANNGQQPEDDLFFEKRKAQEGENKASGKKRARVAFA
ncbi:hypothetical protein IAU59_002183 [Kwoniella sp. CBS 9459]